MAIHVREVEERDKEGCIFAEKYATPHVIYLEEVWERFMKEGGFYVISKDDEIGGIGKITTLFDDVGWLETIRIHPDFQEQGLGNALYQKYMEKIKESGLKKVGLYTEDWNIRSENLAKKYGFEKMGVFEDYRKETTLDLDYSGTFELIEDNAEEVISQYYDKMDDYCIVSKTFFPVIKGLGKDVARRKWAFKDDEGNFAIIGTRMQPEKVLFIAYYDGDIKKVLEFANELAKQYGTAKLSAIRNVNDVKVIEELKDNGFECVEVFMTLYQDFE